MNRKPLSWIDAAWVLGLAALAGGCATASADSAPPLIPLAVPPAPPHVAPTAKVDTADDGTDDATPDVDRLPQAPPAATPPPATAPTSVPNPDATEAPQPPLQLTTDDAGPDDAVVRAAIAETTRMLDQLDRGALSAALRAEYDTARRFLRQASRALSAGQITYAASLGAKARTIADALTPG